MSDLLPYNATEQERALAETTARISDVPVIVREVWNPDTCPSNVLPWLAWAFSVDDWDTNWTDAQKRQVIKESVHSQRIKGTIGAVRNQLAAIGLDIQILEWFKQQPVGQPYTFQVFINTEQSPLDENALKKINQIVNTNKNLRSHISETQISANTTARSFTGAVALIGTEISVTNYTQSVAALNDYVMPQANILTGG